MDYQIKTDAAGQPYLAVNSTDFNLIRDPLLNKGMAFTEQERQDFGLHGLLPSHVATLDEQVSRSYNAFQQKATDLERYIYLRDLQNSNETVFYKLLNQYITEVMPIVYTPTVGLGCQLFSHVYRRPRGVFISYPNRDRIDEILASTRFDRVEVIVVSDGERILGLGDQGAGGMGIPIGKLALYSGCAGIHPDATLAILLDNGTDNPELLSDPLYIGWRHERVRGQAYDDFIEAFVTAVKKRFPNVLLQWEDFAQQNATRLLERYQDQLCTFNDDIQGTASVALGTLFAAIHASKTLMIDQRIVLVGPGSAGSGIGILLKQAMMNLGLSESEARSRFFLVGRHGLLFDDSELSKDFQKPLLQSRGIVEDWQVENPHSITLEEVVRHVKPTVLIGVSGQPGIFNAAVIQEMSRHVERPIIMPLSNPTQRCEGNPEDILAWSEGRALIGTGSPFPKVMRHGAWQRVDQTNNAYIFPGLGLGAIAVRARRISEQMFMVAAKKLAECSPAHANPAHNLLPPLTDIRDISLQMALAVAQCAIDEGLAEPLSPEAIHQAVLAKIWEPAYLPYQKA